MNPVSRMYQKQSKRSFNTFRPSRILIVKEKVVSGYITKFKLNRLDYHVGDGKFFKMGIVGQDVDVTITMEALGDK